MKKYILKTNDAYEARLCLNAPNMLMVITEMDNRLRAVSKYDDDVISSEQAQHWRDELLELCEDYNVRLHE